MEKKSLKKKRETYPEKIRKELFLLEKVKIKKTD